ncbi:MAG: BtpA/SgcQ family protein [Phycisphaerae bacterium]|jgi:hypothetical protein
MFGPNKTVIAMIHTGASPGTPRNRDTVERIVEQAVSEAREYARHGVDALLIENMHDVPYLNGAVGPEVVATMTAVAVAVRNTVPLPLGVQILAAANREALAVALASSADFVRAENFAYAHVADEGLMPTADAGPLLRYRRQIGAERVHVFADVKKKHSSHAITADVSLAEAARTTEFFGAAGVIVTGAATGVPASPADVRCVREAVRVPVLVGSGLTPENLHEYWPHADGFIVGSSLKRDGVWSNPLDPQRIARFKSAAGTLRART